MLFEIQIMILLAKVYYISELQLYFDK